MRMTRLLVNAKFIENSLTFAIFSNYIHLLCSFTLSYFERFGRFVYVFQTQIDVGSDALHWFDSQISAQKVGVGARGGQSEAESVHRHTVVGRWTHDGAEKATVQSFIGRFVRRRVVIVEHLLLHLMWNSTASIRNSKWKKLKKK